MDPACRSGSGPVAIRTFREQWHDAHVPNRTYGRFLVLAVAATLVTGCSTLQQEADDRAAQVADAVLTRALTDELSSSDASTPAERVEVAGAWLSTPDPEVVRNKGPVAWVVRGVEGTVVRVDVYARVESGSFFPPDQGASAWGVACRAYDVAGEVTVHALDCPDGTPEQP